ncbi:MULTISPECIES: WXG100 family type VII secretion target [Mycobacteroides]|uniref:WXG100 family type VII secretion target n=1 Tax=Mycobacteroides TaxID=670516 RepID=UPI0007151D9C|nr:MULTISPECIES: hypothetical protein [Mycobacteroides]KRQ23295.1 hypothetical protein AOT91_23050 [Mycobacteroides sp. H092]KRQ23464.1 hypothetical protein AOT87_12310 [Mycobacteroides sp. H003]KRQ40273.1 hypothetical protein AOT92_14940 [Mycobacteroides sp. H101]KRQ47414.1 hypothetical protein AOT88_15980 [Mycobacteroides sp. H063]KRQ57721.1 hypothetical protein AOT90_25700 [Mycobacteroides sp. H079]
MEQIWDFQVIHAAISVLRGHSNTIQGQNEALEGHLAQGQSVWQGEASDMWGLEQKTLNDHGNEFRTAVESYLNAVEESTHHTHGQELTNAGSFGS